MKKTLFFLLVASVIGCTPKVETVYKDVETIRASDLYNVDSVVSFMDRFGDRNKEMAESYVAQSLTAEANDPLHALYCIKRSVTLCPTREGYKALAAALDKAGNYKELRDVCSLLTSQAAKKVNDQYEYYYPFGEPDTETYGDLLLSMLLADNYLSGYDIYKAKDLKLDIKAIKERIFADKRVKIDMSSDEGKEMLRMFMTEEELDAYAKLETTFRDYLSSIKDASPVFEIGLNDVNKFHYEDFNGMNESEEDYDYNVSETKTTAIYRRYLQENVDNPDGWPSYNLTHFIDINEHVKAVIYAVDSSETACPINMRHIYHRLVTYDDKAKIIDSKIVACQLGEKAMTASFNQDKFSVTEYKRNWKKPYIKLPWGNDFDNDLLGTDQLKTTSYHITPDGKIEEAAI